ncbi:MAG: D-alanyl-D-alanine carboxypeptidase [Clostridiales bacterium]|nr:D-alanyl-D-alanine carboxypeptidase [Clostridiales bacterium]
MKNKFSVIFLILAFMMIITCFCGFTNISNNIVSADEKIEIKSKSAYVIDADTKTVIFSKDENRRLPIASMCKIMTLLLYFEAQDCGDISIDEQIKISENSAGMGGSQVFLEANAEYSAGELIKSIVVASANDACVAIAERLYGDEQDFVQKMNEKAQELGMNNTVFVNCTGLPKPGQYSCAQDVATMFTELIKHEDYFRYSRIWTDKVLHPKDRVCEISNTNKLIRFYNGCDCGKTGYTVEAGHCLVASAKRGGMRLISVVISAPDGKTRFKETSSMFNYGFANYTNKMILDQNKPLELDVKVLGGKPDKLEVVSERSVFLFSKKNEKRSVELDFVPINKIKAPIKKGDIVGKICVYENNIEIDCVNVLANEDVEGKTYFDVIKDIWQNWALI